MDAGGLQSTRRLPREDGQAGLNDASSIRPVEDPAGVLRSGKPMVYRKIGTPSPRVCVRAKGQALCGGEGPSELEAELRGDVVPARMRKLVYHAARLTDIVARRSPQSDCDYDDSGVIAHVRSLPKSSDTVLHMGKDDATLPTRAPPLQGEKFRLARVRWHSLVEWFHME